MLSRFVIAFFPRSKHLNFTGALTIHRDFGVQENTETQTLVKVNLSTILDLFCSKQFMSCPGAVILLKYVPCLLPSCFKSRKSWREDPEGRVGRHLSTHTWRHPDDQFKQWSPPMVPGPVSTHRCTHTPALCGSCVRTLPHPKFISMFLCHNTRPQTGGSNRNLFSCAPGC